MKTAYSLYEEKKLNFSLYSVKETAYT